MTTLIDRIVIAVPDLVSAQEDFQRLLGVDAFGPRIGEEHVRVWFSLPNAVIELREQAVTQAVLLGLVFSSSESSSIPAPLSNPLGLALQICDGQQTGHFKINHPVTDSLFSVDHIVLQTRDADACVSFFKDQLGIRLALDKTVPQWGGRMLFFRTGKLTLEVIESSKDKPERDRFWGIALQCDDLEQTSTQLTQLGVGLSKLRDGRKPGTRVATVKSHSLGIPTLLIEPAKTQVS